MLLNRIEYILFDANNTLIHKPTIWPSLTSVLAKHGYIIEIGKLMFYHKLISEVVNFPDRTSKEFYNYFNSELLMSLGILPTKELLDEIFKTCCSLPWERFNDTMCLNNCQIPIGVVSNFNDNLSEILQNLFGNIFSIIVVSESLKIRKPDIAIFQYAMDLIGLPASNILYVGDSLKLDIVPASKVGFKVLLIDRLNIYIKSNLQINSISEIFFYQ